MRNRLKLVMVVILLMVIPACSGPLKFLTGGGPNVAANVPIAAGQEVEQNQGFVNMRTEAPQVTLRPKSRVGSIEQNTNRVQSDRVETVVVNEVPTWVILLLVLGWLFPSPGEIGRWVRSLFSKRAR